MFNRLFFVMSLCFFALPSMAQNFFDDLLSKPPGDMNYRYLSVSFVDYDEAGDGLGFSGSFEVKENIAAQIYYDNTSENSVDVTVLGADAIVHQEMPKMDSTDLILGAGVRKVDVPSDSEFGLVFTAGARKEMDPDLEFNAMVQIETVDGMDIDFGFGGVYEISPILHFQADYRIAGEDGFDRLGLGVRYYLN